LFVDVQRARVFSDGKTFVDTRPKTLMPAALRALYAQARRQPAFSLRDFPGRRLHTWCAWPMERC